MKSNFGLVAPFHFIPALRDWGEPDGNAAGI